MARMCMREASVEEYVQTLAYLPMNGEEPFTELNEENTGSPVGE